VGAFRLEGPARSVAAPRVVDITDEVVRAVQDSGVSDGICCVYSLRTTSVIRVNEFEAGLLEDFARLLCFFERDDAENDDARCKSMLLGPAGETIPVANGKLCLGTWQRVLFLELNGRSGGRWTVQIVGSGHAPSTMT
jgi:secondary thiamine-phosphate synthase enzyme